MQILCEITCTCHFCSVHSKSGLKYPYFSDSLFISSIVLTIASLDKKSLKSSSSHAI